MSKKLIRLAWQICVLALLISHDGYAGEMVKTELNSLEIGVDADTGGLRLLSHPATGVALEADAESASLLDMAYPTEAFQALRLATRFSKARVQKEDGRITIIWERLGPSRARYTMPAGTVRAEVTLRAAPDRRSIIMVCRVENRSDSCIPQILFPDFVGLQAFAGTDETQLRFANGVVKPFAGLPNDYKGLVGHWYEDWWDLQSYFPEEHTFLPYLNRWKLQPVPAKHVLRWIDLGGCRGGLSLFEKRWGDVIIPTIYTYRSESRPEKLRLCWQQRVTLEPGGNWESAEYWLTPHYGGWAKGIEVYRDYVRDIIRPRQLPDQVRDGLGMQTVHMMDADETDEKRADFRFADLSQIASDAKKHGLEMIAIWQWKPLLGREDSSIDTLLKNESFANALSDCRRQGVTVLPVVKIGELIERSPFFGGANSSILDKGLAWGSSSFVCESFTSTVAPGAAGAGGEPTPEFLWLERSRKATEARGSQCVWAGDPKGNLEYDSAVLDFTWSWNRSLENAAIMNVLQAPRINFNIDDDALEVRQAFATGLYLNIMPHNADRPNGTALISARPALSTALAQVAILRQKFLRYFVKGLALGDSMLSKPCAAFVRGYLQNDRMLVIVLNDQSSPREFLLCCDLNLWMPAKKWSERYYDNLGIGLESRIDTAANWSRGTKTLAPYEFAFYEIRVE